MSNAIEVSDANFEEEVKILEEVSNLRITNDLCDVKAIVSRAELADFKKLVTQIRIEPHLLEYRANLVEESWENPDLYFGASPRASIGILNSS